VVGEAKIIEDKQEVLGELASPEFDPEKYVILEKQLPDPLALNSSTLFKEADITYYSPNIIRLSVDIEQPGMLVLSEVWQPGWIATDNNITTEIYTADYM
jgi:hypothetical protein